MLILSYHVTLLDTGQNSTSVDVKLTPLNWRPALYSWQKRVFPAELHQLCVNNQALTCGVKPCNWSDTSKRRLAPSQSGKTPHASNKGDKRGVGGGGGGARSCTCIDTDLRSHTKWVWRQKEGGLWHCGCAYSVVLALLLSSFFFFFTFDRKTEFKLLLIY